MTKGLSLKIPLPFMILDIIIGVLIIGLGVLMGILEINDYLNFINIEYASDFVINYGVYVIISSIIVYIINILIGLKNINRYMHIFVFSIMPMLILCITHTFFSIAVHEVLLSTILLLPVISIYVVIFLEIVYLYKIERRF